LNTRSCFTGNFGKAFSAEAGKKRKRVPWAVNILLHATPPGSIINGNY